MDQTHKEVIWLGDSRRRVQDFPKPVRREVGQALYNAQCGDWHPSMKRLRGRKEFSGGVVIEIRADFDGDTYRTVYTARVGDAIYVLHAFQKKSPRGIETAKHDIDLIVKRLKDAQALEALRSR